VPKKIGLFALVRRIRERKKVKVKPVNVSKLKAKIMTPSNVVIRKSKELSSYLKRKAIYAKKSIYE